MLLNGLVICADEAHREKRLLKQIRRHDPTVFHPPKGFPTVASALADAARGDPPDYALLSLKGSPPSAAEQNGLLEELLRGLPKVPAVVELADDKPERAFDLLKRGAFDVRSGEIWKVEKLCQSLHSACGPRKPPYPFLMPLEPDGDGHWAFMSMSFARTGDNANAYGFAICPAIRALGHSPTKVLQTAEDIVPDGTQLELRARVHEAIKRRKVVVALLSPPDPAAPPNPNCMYEIGYAAAVDPAREVLVLWQENVEQPEPPVMCPPNLRVQYSSKTELALALFFGLLGTPDHLTRYWRP